MVLSGLSITIGLFSLLFIVISYFCIKDQKYSKINVFTDLTFLVLFAISWFWLSPNQQGFGDIVSILFGFLLVGISLLLKVILLVLSYVKGKA